MQEYIKTIDKICSHLKNAAVELVAAKSLSTAFMSKLKAERIAKGHSTGGPWWAITSTFESAASRALRIIEDRMKHWDILSKDARTK